MTGWAMIKGNAKQHRRNGPYPRRLVAPRNKLRPVRATRPAVNINPSFRESKSVLADAPAVKNEVTTMGQDQQPMIDGT